MLIFELTKPGSSLLFDDMEVSRKFERLLNQLETAFYDANVALNLFNAERNNTAMFDENSFHQHRDDFQNRQILEAQVRQELGLGPYEGYEQVRVEVDTRLKRDKWSKGITPLSHQQRIIFLHAKSFLNALDTIDKFVKVISEETGAPDNIKKLHAKIAEDFPHLRAVRNSAQHLEDRARGLGAGKVPKPLKLQPLDNGFVIAPQGALMLSNLFGTKFGYTMADGHYGEVDVSEESMRNITTTIQEVFDSFTWQGFQQHLPR
ncbi:hypothetical protein [Enterobacter kobei]|uniref:hypothetical protein n=1 Tax=Enterobacter kobei TaxID=208224 RepID=UPI00079506C4|nr:hypothetical protein [Enterobacter kobei]CZW54384.1 Uncharacterised protein [Enterobacter kobei]